MSDRGGWVRELSLAKKVRKTGEDNLLLDGIGEAVVGNLHVFSLDG
jgi:hypothetical protein